MNPGQGELRRQVRLNLIDQPVQGPESINLDDAIETALQKRPEVLQAKKNIETSDLQVNFAKNQVLPVLAIQGSAGLSGLGTEPSDMINRNFGGDFYNWGVGLILSYPIGNRSAWSQLTKSQLEAQNAQSSLENAQQQVILSVKEAVRRVQTDLKRIEPTRAGRILAEKQLLAEQERLKLGLSITGYVVDFQRDLATARANLVRAIVDYNKSLSNLARNKASTLELDNIALQ
jgi:outer membrane protein